MKQNGVDISSLPRQRDRVSLVFKRQQSNGHAFKPHDNSCALTRTQGYFLSWRIATGGKFIKSNPKKFKWNIKPRNSEESLLSNA